MSFKNLKKNVQNIKIKAILKPIEQLAYSFIAGVFVTLEYFFGYTDMTIFAVYIASYIAFISYTFYDANKNEILFQHLKKRTQEYYMVVEIAKVIKNADSKEQKELLEKLIEALTINVPHKNDKK